MPTCCEWLDPVTREPVSRNHVVDKEVAEAYKQPFSKENFCIAFQVLEFIGIAMLAKGGSLVTPEMCDKFFVERKEYYPNDEENALARHFLSEKYIFTAWYQSH